MVKRGDAQVGDELKLGREVSGDGAHAVYADKPLGLEQVRARLAAGLEAHEAALPGGDEAVGDPALHHPAKTRISGGEVERAVVKAAPFSPPRGDAPAGASGLVEHDDGQTVIMERARAGQPRDPRADDRHPGQKHRPGA